MSKIVKKSTALIFSLLFLISGLAVMGFAEDGYTATFVTDGHCTITTYLTQDYTGTSYANQTTAVARDSDTGEVDTSGSGQINFTVVLEDGYEIASVSVEGSYKNLKDSSDTGLENTYRITKVASDLTVTVTTAESASAVTYSEEVSIVFADDSVTVDPECTNAEVDGTAVTISAEGTYTVSGSCSDGNITVAKGSGEVTLILDGLTLTSTTTAPIAAKSSTVVTIEAAEGTVNTLTDTDRSAASPKSCINSAGDLILTGSGALVVNGNNKNGIKADGDVTIDSLTLTVNSVDNSIAADNVLTLNGGVITAVSSEGDCLKADPDAITASTAGNIVINGGSITLNAEAGDGIQALGTVTVTGGTIDITTNGGYKSTLDESVSTKGIKGDSGIAISGGTFTINSCDDAIHSGGDVAITGGTFTIYTSDDGIHSDTALTLSGADITVAASYEGLEGADIVIESGTYSVTSSDDGINAAGTTDTASNPMAVGNGTLTINGGTVYVNANGDGLDVNGSVTMNDGIVLVVGSASSGDGALDYDRTFTVNGGTLIALGQSGMAQSVSGSVGIVAFTTMSSIKSNTLCYVTDGSGNVLFAWSVNKSYNSIVIASDKISSGEGCTLYTGGTAAGESIYGFYVNEVSVSGGSQANASSSTGGVDGGSTSGILGFFQRIIEFFRKILMWLGIIK